MKHHWVKSEFHGGIVCRDCWYIKELLGNVSCDRTQFISDSHKWKWVKQNEMVRCEAGGYWQCSDCHRIVLGGPAPTPTQSCGSILMDQVLI